MAHRVVVTGLGVCSALGSGVDTFWAALCNGQSGIKRHDDLTPDGPVLAGVVPDLEPWSAEKGTRRPPDRMIQLAHAAVSQMVASDPQRFPPHTALLWGTGYTAMATIESGYELWYTQQKVRADTVPACMPAAVLAHLCNAFGLRGMSTMVSASCASGLQSVGLAYELLRHGIYQSALAGSSDAPLTPGMFRAWRPLRVLAPHTSPEPAKAYRPFSPDRNGLVLAEGAAAFHLETLEHARARNAPIWAEVCGFSASTSEGSIVAPAVDQQATTLRTLLERAHIAPDAIGYINAHATATRIGDAAETATIRQVFGPLADQLPVSAIKGATGHAMGASSSLETAATILALAHGILPPTINWSPGDPECTLDYVPNAARRAQPIYAIKESFGFGGANAALLLRRFVDPSRSAPTREISYT